MSVSCRLRQPALAERIKDPATVAGVRNNQWSATASITSARQHRRPDDADLFTTQAIGNMLSQMGGDGLAVPEAAAEERRRRDGDRHCRRLRGRSARSM